MGRAAPGTPDGPEAPGGDGDRERRRTATDPAGARSPRPARPAEAGPVRSPAHRVTGHQITAPKPKTGCEPSVTGGDATPGSGEPAERGNPEPAAPLTTAPTPRNAVHGHPAGAGRVLPVAANAIDTPP